MAGPPYRGPRTGEEEAGELEGPAEAVEGWSEAKGGRAGES